MLPDFIIVGAMKGGTTSLFRYIASHPDIRPSSIKETDFFLNCSNFSKGVDWYKGLFQGKGSYAFEASPNYTKRHMFPDVPARMHSLLPDVKLIYVVRDPIDRIVSHYIHNYSHGRDFNSFSEAIKNTKSNYIQTSRYYFQIQAFLEYYSDKQLLLLESEQLSRDPAKVLNCVFEFLGISPEYDQTLLSDKFHTSSKKTRRSILEQKLRQKVSNPHLLRVVKNVTKPFRKPIERPLISPRDIEIVSDAIGPDIDKFRQYSGLKLTGWSI